MKLPLAFVCNYLVSTLPYHVMNQFAVAPTPPAIKVTLLLAGGHRYSLFLQPDDPVLQQLLDTIVARTQTDFVTARLFQLSLDGGRSLLTVASEDVVAVITEPPMVLGSSSPPPQPAVIAAVTPADPPLDSPTEGILPSHYVQLGDFLSPDEHNRLLEYVFRAEPEFVSTQTSSTDESYRRSLILYQFPEFRELMVQRIRAVMPEVMHKLAMPPFPVGQIEAQLTAHGDGNYYKIHNDNGSPDTASRELTYVYYFYREPKSFTGGELRLYDSKVANGFYVAAETFRTVEPLNNSVVFFPSRYLHEVMLVNCPSRQFGDYRFTINGWIRQHSIGLVP